MTIPETDTNPFSPAFCQALLHSVGDAIVVIGLDHVISSLNHIAEQITQWSGDDARGRALTDVVSLVAESNREAVETPVERVLRSGETTTIPLQTLLIGRYGEETPIRGRVAAVRESDGRITGAVIVFRSTAELHENERQFQNMIEQVADHVIFMTDPEGIVKSWNLGVKSVLGYEADEFIGHHIGGLIFTDEGIEEGVPEWEFETARDKGSAIDDRWMKRKDGSHFWASGIMAVLRNKSGDLVGFSKIMRDLTEQKTNVDAIRKLNFDLTQAQQRKDDFIVTLAHELRNPLAPITSALTLLEDHVNVNDNARELHSVAQVQVGQLVRLVEDLLDVSRIGRGKVSIERVACELQTIIATGVDSCKDFINSSSQSLRLDVTRHPIFVSADASRLIQVVTNVLNNAAKYTPEGGAISLSVQLRDGFATIVVSDDGIGIPEDELDTVFELFAQASPSSERGKAGLGIGLALVKRIVDLHQGKIEITSDGKNQGTTVTIQLPTVKPGETSKIKSSEEDVATATVEAVLRVLVVDDTPAITFTLGRLVEKLGHEVQTAQSGEDALKMIDVSRPDVVISDISMPEMSGYELASKIRSHFGTTIMLVAMTGYSNEGAKRKVLDAGFDRHMIKPPDIRQLKIMFESFQESHSEVAKQQTPGTSRPN